LGQKVKVIVKAFEPQDGGDGEQVLMGLSDLSVTANTPQKSDFSLVHVNLNFSLLSGLFSKGRHP
jgi:hypothetical protein